MIPFRQFQPLCRPSLQHLLAPAGECRGRVQHGAELHLREHHAEEHYNRGSQVLLRAGSDTRQPRHANEGFDVSNVSVMFSIGTALEHSL